MRGHGLIGDIAGALVGLGRAIKGQETPGTLLDALRIGPRKTNTGRIDLFGTPSNTTANVTGVGATTGLVTDEVNVEYSTRMGVWWTVDAATAFPVFLIMEVAADSTTFLPLALVGTYAAATVGPIITVIDPAAGTWPQTLALNNIFVAPLYATMWQLPANSVATDTYGLMLNLDVSVQSVVRFRLFCAADAVAWIGYTLSSQGG